MNKEIKEILAYFEEYIKITDMHDSEPMLNWKDLKIVLDYITNLQEKVNQYENPDDMTLFYMWLDEKAKDKMKQLEADLLNVKQQFQIAIDINSKKQQIIDKAIEYIKSRARNAGVQLMPREKELLEILVYKGEDNE